MPDLTTILNGISGKQSGGSTALLTVIYEELRRMAAGRMADERAGHTLQPTALVNEAYLRLVGSDQNWANRRHFFGAAAEAMRRILIESARRKQAAKRGAGASITEFREAIHDLPQDDRKLLEVHEVLDALEAEDPPRAEVVKLRFFVGLTVPEIAALQRVSERTVARHWELAKVWLVRAIREGHETSVTDVRFSGMRAHE